MDTPAHWEADVLLADGGVVHIRPITGADGPAIRDMHDRMSQHSRYLRYFTAVEHLSDRQLALFTDIDQVDSIGLAAELGGRLIALGTCYRDPQRPATAEVAFIVEDAQQRRGLGSILLEHLAGAAQDRGVTRFTAEVLGENRSMVRVFTDTGYEINRAYESGVIELVFDTAPTQASRAVMVAREQRAEARSIARLLTPTSVAVIGELSDSAGLAAAALASLTSAGFVGDVFTVDPAGPGPRSLAELAEPVDLAVLALPAAQVAPVLADAQRRGVHAVVVLSGGFTVTGGALSQRELVHLARAGGMRVLGPNCLGLINTDPTVALNATLRPELPPPGPIGFFCQSAALGLAILAEVRRRGLGLSTFVSAGHRADVSGNDLLQFWATDPRTQVVVLYLESFGNPRKFARLARVLARIKPVITVRSGRHQVTTPGLAASSGAPEAALDALFARSGVIRTNTLDSAVDVAELLAAQPVPRGGRVAVVGNSAALGVLALDALLDAGLSVAGGAPVDLGIRVTPDELAATVADQAVGGDVDAVLLVLIPAVGGPGVGALLSAVGPTPVPVLAAVVDPPADLPAATIPRFATPERAVRALSAAVGYGHWLGQPAGEIPDLPGLDRPAARASVELIMQKSQANRTAGGRVVGVSGVFPHDQHDRGPSEPALMTDDELTEVLRCYGVAVADFAVVDDPEEAAEQAERIGFPVVAKSTDPGVRHRVDRAGVRVRLTDADQVRAAVAELLDAGAPSVYVQAMAGPGTATVDTAFAITADPSFGALVSFAVGGVAIDLLDDRAFAAVPLTDADAVELIAAPRAAALLTGYRGMAPADRGALVDLALRLSALADDNPEVRSLELRPVLVGPAGLCIAGATGAWGPAAPDPDDRRRLR